MVRSIQKEFTGTINGFQKSAGMKMGMRKIVNNISFKPVY
jgi:hypothetical protein